VPAKKPTTGLRTRKPPAADRERKIELERIARKHERPNNDVEERAARGIVKRAGRTFADGRSSPAGELRRLAVYIPLELFDELEARARAGRRTLSETTAAALADQFGVTLEATG
jgi:hypothetical protein